MAGSYNELFGLGAHSEDADLVGWWPLQETSGTTAVDESSNSYDGTTTGAAVNQTGPGGAFPLAYNFNGTSDYVTLTSTENVNIWGLKTGVSLLARVKQETQATTQCHLGQYEGFSSGDQCAYPILETDGTINYRVLRNGTNAEVRAKTTGDVDLDDGSWHTVALTCHLDGNVMVFRVDKASEAFSYVEQSNASTSFPNDAQRSWGKPFMVGAWNNDGVASNFFDGSIADVSIFSRALTTTEADQWADGPEPIYTSGVSFADSGAYNVGTWDNQSNGSNTFEVVAVNAAGTVIDSATISTGTLDLSAEAGNLVYLLVRATNSGGYDIGDFATRTSGYGSANDGYYELASVTAAGGGSSYDTSRYILRAA